MGHNYQKNNANIKKLVTPGNFIAFPIKWRKPHCSKFIRLEMTSKTKLLLKVEKIHINHYYLANMYIDKHYGT